MKEKFKYEEKQKKKIIIVSVILIVILVSVSLMYINSSKNNVKIKSTLKTYNAELQENEYMHLETDASRDKVPVPNGYVGSKASNENEINTGYVIYEGEEEVNNDSVEEAQRTRNQYVWIPVPEPSKIYGIDSNGKKWGKLYEFTTDTGNNIDSVTGAKPLNWSESNGVMTISSKMNHREPDIVLKNSSTVYDMDSGLKTLGLGENVAHKFLNQLEKEFYRMIASIEKYGGFYIGRYETGDLNQETAVVKKENNNFAGQTWYIMYQKCKTLRGENKNVETGLIWGSQWDRTLMWLVESENKNKEELIDSVSWGNYTTSSFEYKNINGKNVIKKENETIKIPTGSSEYTKANNIYDLAGNVWEWTMEANYQNSRLFRGGAIGNFNIPYAYVSFCDKNNGFADAPINKANDVGCRASLYIK